MDKHSIVYPEPCLIFLTKLNKTRTWRMLFAHLVVLFDRLRLIMPLK